MRNSGMKNGKAGGLSVLILAAGQGTRMQSEIPKVMHPLGGRPLIYYLLRLANAMKPGGIGVVVGHQEDLVKKQIAESLRAWGISRAVTFIRQKEPTGSGGAVLDSLPFLKKFQTSLVMCGDAPLLTFDTLYALHNHHRSEKGQVTLLTARLHNPQGYGRIIRSPIGEVMRIVEQSHATQKEALINEVNSGTYCFEVPPLIDAVRKLRPQGSKEELYLTDCLEYIRSNGGRVMGHLSSIPEEILGVNTRVQLAQAERVINRRMLERLMLSGVTIVDPNHIYVDADVEVGRDSVLYPGTILKGKTKIGRNCRIGPYTQIEDSAVGNESSVEFSLLRSARVLEKSVIGPYAHLRPDTVAGPRARIGNFTEIKASRIGFGSKVPHLSYVGDTEIAEDVNVGAGTITCNYDGEKKHKTIIGAKVFVGSNVSLVAPVKIGRGAKIGAGSTITEDVPAGELAIARARQVNKVKK